MCPTNTVSFRYLLNILYKVGGGVGNGNAAADNDDDDDDDDDNNNNNNNINVNTLCMCIWPTYFVIGSQFERKSL